MFLLPSPAVALPDAAPSNEDCEINSGSYVFRDEAILGTRLQIDLVARNYSDAQAAALNARNEIDRLNLILNNRSSDSELSILNRSRIHRASPELFAVVTAAERWRTETSSAFSGRLGRVISVWEIARDQTPSRMELARLACAADKAFVELDSSTRTITRPDEVEFALDALAKGWIVDHAFKVARSSPGISGALVNIGGDIRCGGRAPDNSSGSSGWRVEIPDARIAIDNAPRVATAHLSKHAIATSGRGQRDRIIGGVRYSPTLSPHDGWPVHHAISVTAMASSAADADALATALLSMPKQNAIAFANRHDVSASIQTNDEVTFTQSETSQVRFWPVNAPQAKTKVQASAKTNTTATGLWPKDWVALITFTAPPRQLVRDESFRSPYMAMWITDLDNKPIRTLLLVGTRDDWQKDNYIWWAINNDTVKHLMATRSMSTSGSGIYRVLWDGTDDQFQQVPGGTYVLHIETSRERGKHTHRSLTLDFTLPKKFTDELASTEEAGGVYVSFGHP